MKASLARKKNRTANATVAAPGGKAREPRRSKVVVGPPKPARPRALSIVSHAVQFVQVVSGPKVNDAEFDRRMALCAACPKRKQHEGNLYCGACGCGQWPLAELHTKLRFARLQCPLDPPRFTAIAD